jgi:hypothetical protein
MVPVRDADSGAGPGSVNERPGTTRVLSWAPAPAVLPNTDSVKPASEAAAAETQTSMAARCDHRNGSAVTTIGDTACTDFEQEKAVCCGVLWCVVNTGLLCSLVMYANGQN